MSGIRWRRLAQKMGARAAKCVPPSMRDIVMSAALVGAWDAERRDPECGIGYAKLRIRGEINDELRRHDWTVRWNRNTPTRARPVYLEALRGEDGREYPLQYEGVPDAEELTIRRDAARVCARALRALDIPRTREHHDVSREISVVYEHYFLGKTMSAIADEQGISQVAVSLVARRARKRMLERLEMLGAMDDGARLPTKCAASCAISGGA